MTSRIFADCLCDVRVEVVRRGRGGLGGRRMGGVVEAKVQSRGVYSGVVRGVGRSCEARGLLCGRDFERLASGNPSALGRRWARVA